jgi:hypothetical protein
MVHEDIELARLGDLAVMARTNWIGLLSLVRECMQVWWPGLASVANEACRHKNNIVYFVINGKCLSQSKLCFSLECVYVCSGCVWNTSEKYFREREFRGRRRTWVKRSCGMQLQHLQLEELGLWSSQIRERCLSKLRQLFYKCGCIVSSQILK